MKNDNVLVRYAVVKRLEELMTDITLLETSKERDLTEEERSKLPTPLKLFNREQLIEQYNLTINLFHEYEMLKIRLFQNGDVNVPDDAENFLFAPTVVLIKEKEVVTETLGIFNSFSKLMELINSTRNSKDLKDVAEKVYLVVETFRPGHFVKSEKIWFYYSRNNNKFLKILKLPSILGWTEEIFSFVSLGTALQTKVKDEIPPDHA